MNTPSQTPYLRLVGDIGGTHARFALARGGELIESSAIALETAEHASLIDAIQVYLQRVSDRAGLSASDIREVRVAIAGPVNSDEITMTNAHWHFSVHASGETLRRSALPQLESFRIINDFAAQAMALPHLKAAHVINLGTIDPQHGVQSVLGPGTGFGAASIAPLDGKFAVLPSEGGHASIAPETAQELAIVQWLLHHDCPVTRETLLSGPGLERLHLALCAIASKPIERAHAPDIVANALAGDTDCRATLTQFCLWLGTAARDQALMCGARGGVYISGGIVQHFVDFFVASAFRQRFESSPMMADYLRTIPTYLISSPDTGLIGAAYAP